MPLNIRYFPSKPQITWFLIFTSLYLTAPLVQAYSYRTCDGNAIKWNNNQTTLYLSTTSFPASSSWDTRLQNAMWHWNNVKGSRFFFYVSRDTDGTHNNSNDKNEVYLDNSLSGDTLAVTKTRYHCYWLFGWHKGIDETDIGFNNNKSWNTGSLNYSNLYSPYNFESVALHELGHALGLKHENRWMATMNAKYPNGGPLGHYKEWDPLADDRLGSRAIYPDSTTETDLGASAFKQTGSGTSGLVSSPLSASRGSYITLEFTFSNQSTATQSFDIDFYLSTNNYISTSDILLDTNYDAWGDEGSIGTFSRTLYIPSSLSPGTYWLGFILDQNNVAAEANESNNYMEMPRQITIY